MTTLHDWVHELESINTRGQELRKLIADEVAKCGGSVGWGDGTNKDALTRKTTNFDEVTFNHSIVFSGTDSSYLTDGKKYKIIQLDAEDKTVSFRDDDGMSDQISCASDYQWYATLD